jgi:hypothetical protein
MPDPHTVVSGLYVRPSYTVATLPSAATSVNESLYVSDQTYNCTTFGTGASGGGTFRMRVRSDGSQWRVATSR